VWHWYIGMEFLGRGKGEMSQPVFAGHSMEGDLPTHYLTYTIALQRFFREGFSGRFDGVS